MIKQLDYFRLLSSYINRILLLLNLINLNKLKKMWKKTKLEK